MCIRDRGAGGGAGAQGAQGSSGSATLSNNADNRVITGGSGTNLNGEANLTFDGKTLTTQTLSYPETTELTTEFKAGVANGNRFKNRYIKLTNTYTGSAHGGLPIIWETNADNSNNKGYGAVVTEYDGSIRFLNSGATSAKAVGTDLLSTVTERLRITGTGNVRITSGVIENAKTISSNYTVSSNYNAMSAGPISVSNGVSVTVPSGSAWTIV